MITPSTQPGVRGMEVMDIMPMISFTVRMLIPNSSSARERVRYLPSPATVSMALSSLAILILPNL